MATNHQPPIRTGLLDFLGNSTGCQFVIPVYQRNYTWTAAKEVRQFLDDFENVLTGEYKNHFLGIMIYLDKTIDFSTREFSVIDGQQRLTTTFLTLYAIKGLLTKEKMWDSIAKLEGQFLTNPFASEKIKYKLKPLVSDDEVYQRIIENELDKITNRNSNVYKNYTYIMKRLENMLDKHPINDILMALNRLYIVCVPLSKDDNAQKIFESINATGVKLTASDLIRNFLLMDMPSEQQEKLYKKYWKYLEDILTNDSKKLEAFFRFFLAAQTKVLPNKTVVYKVFMDWFHAKAKEAGVEEIFKEIVVYADCYHAIYKKELQEMDLSIRYSLKEFRRILSDMPAPLLMELYHLYNQGFITGEQLNDMISSINSYLMRRALCNLDTSSISRLFPSLLKDILVDCDGDYSQIVELLHKNLVSKNIGNAMFMPSDVQLEEAILNANMYSIRFSVRIFLDKLEHHDNPAPVDLGSLSIEHIMPQTPTEKWYVELGIDEETYQRHVHRLGNLTLAAKKDNSTMRNEVWEYKNQILSGTSHLKLNEELLTIEQWNIEAINQRTVELIDKIKMLYPYPAVRSEIIPKVPIYITSNGIVASGYLYLDNGNVEIEIGSQLYTVENVENYPEIEDIRQELLEERVIAETEQGLCFVEPYMIHSRQGNYTALSSSATIILHGSRNGWEAWVNDAGIPLKDIPEIKNKFS